MSETRAISPQGTGKARQTLGEADTQRPVDRRVRKTKALLKHCLAELLKTKKINEITVRELTDLSDLNRGTFYLHYRDVYDLLEKTEDELIDAVHELLQQHEPAELKLHPHVIFEEIFTLAKDNRDIVEILMGEHGDLQFQDRLKEVVKEKCLKDAMEVYRSKNPENYTVFFYFMLSGCIGILQYWIKTGFKESPSEIARITEKILHDGIQSLDQI
ncbi:MAG: TetR/AcrR family transcriptional regulator [Eubacteriales bacterium]|nr:TetR/AcrR family transcriptional regulator [Eubacteriales bacterium]